MTLTLGSCLAVAVALTRSVLPRSLRFLATNSSAELFQLTVLAFCLVNAWISGYLVSPSALTFVRLQCLLQVQLTNKTITTCWVWKYHYL